MMQSLNKSQMSHPSFILKVLTALAQALRSRDPFSSKAYVHNRKGQRIALLVWTDKAPGRFLMCEHDPRVEHSNLMVSIIEDCGNTLHLQWLKELQEHARLKLKVKLDEDHKRQEQTKRHLWSSFSLFQEQYQLTATQMSEMQNVETLKLARALREARRAHKSHAMARGYSASLQYASECLAHYKNATAMLQELGTDSSRHLEVSDVDKFREMRRVVGLDERMTATEIILSRAHLDIRDHLIHMDYSELEERYMNLICNEKYNEWSSLPDPLTLWNMPNMKPKTFKAFESPKL